MAWFLARPVVYVLGRLGVCVIGRLVAPVLALPVASVFGRLAVCVPRRLVLCVPGCPMACVLGRQRFVFLGVWWFVFSEVQFMSSDVQRPVFSYGRWSESLDFQWVVVSDVCYFVFLGVYWLVFSHVGSFVVLGVQ